MSRFDQEWSVVPKGARWTAGLVALACAVAMTGIALGHAAAGKLEAPLFVFFPLILIGAAALAVYVLLLGYIYGDARRRGMSRLLWMLLAIFIPYAVGIILYFVLREPVLVPCPSCGASARKGHAYCAHCGTAVRTACPSCREPVEAGWRNCTRCGHALHPPAAGSQASTGA
jgi:Double zinc ribbon/Phospholipase_D-nuclease N-terminal